jgi:hypothetical protein
VTERPALRALPALRNGVSPASGLDYHMEATDSAPHAFIRAEVAVRITARTIEIFHRGGASPSMSAAMAHYQGTVDSNGEQLTGAKKFKGRFQGEAPFIAPSFWSLTMYDASNYYTVPNPIDRYFLGSDTPMKKNKHGCLIIYIQRTVP